MPLIEFDESEKSRSSGGYPKLKLQHGERARINVIQTKVHVAFMHRLEAPEIVGGRPVMEMVKASRDSDEMVPKPKMKFISNPACFGRYDVLKEKGKDPEECVVCAAAAEHDSLDYPQRRFGVHIIHYATRDGGWDAQEPMNAALKLWVFGPKKFDTLVDKGKEWGPLKEHDLKLGPCINSDFQNYDIDVAKNAVWKESDQNKKFVAELVEKNQCEDVEAEIVRKVKLSLVEEDLATVISKSKQASAALNTAAGIGTVTEAVATEEPTADVSGMIDDGTVEASSDNGEVKSFDDILNDI